MAEKKLFTRTVQVGTSKTKGVKYLYIKEEDTNGLIFVNLIKDNKGYKPNLNGVKEIEVTYSSYKREDNRLALFGVTEVVFYK